VPFRTRRRTFSPQNSPGVSAVTPDVTITIVSWNTSALLRDCLTSLIGAYLSPGPRQRMEIHVVDNASQDDSVSMVKNEFRDDVRLFQSPENVGFARANNASWKVAKGRYWLLLNSDTQIFPGAIEKLVQFMDAHPKCGLATAKLLNPDGTPQFCAQPEPSVKLVWYETLRIHKFWTPKKRARKLLSTYFGYDEAVRVGWTWGTALIARREAVQECGPLDETFHMYGEDTEWCLRMRRAGWQVWFCPDAEIVHYGGQSSAKRWDNTEKQLRIDDGFFRAVAMHKGPKYAEKLRRTMNFSVRFEYAVRRFRSGYWLRREAWFHAPDPVQHEPPQPEKVGD
jgi:N-acetylglucosaminyl-diphospho-decaprenol L-rhamnosyltransferase